LNGPAQTLGTAPVEFVSFGRKRTLLGVHSAATGRPRKTGIVICPSVALEYERCYRGLGILAQHLAASGFETLRFDYSCTGDSFGFAPDALIEHWAEDVAEAARELQQLANLPRIALLGMRLGALIAARALQHGARAQSLFCWDPPVTGAQWLDEMRALNRAHYAKKNRYRTPDYQLVPPTDALLGMPMSPQLIDGIAGLELAPATPALPVTVISTDGSQLTTLPDAATRVLVPDEPNWMHAAWLHTPWSPARSFAVVRDHLQATLP
jgi:alpha/beta superfamily hydrolase